MAGVDGSETHDLVALLSGDGRDFLVRNNGEQVKVGDLDGEIVGIYFSAHWCPPCRGFTPMLAEAYADLSPKGFEVVFVSSDRDEGSFQGYLSEMPWLAVPFSDSATRQRAKDLFKVRGIPHLVVLDGSTGKVLTTKAVAVLREYGTDAYPFTPERLAELEKARQESQTLESLLVSGELDHVIGKDGAKQIPVSELVGKNILLYFSAHWCPPCRGFTPQLVQAYNEIKAQNSDLEVIFISSDRDQSSFDEYFSGMPWLALPFGDERKKSLNRKFKVAGIPTLVAIGPSGRTVTTEAREMVGEHGAAAYPFTEDRIKQLEQEMEDKAKGWPEKVKHRLHEEHELVLTRQRIYGCDGCDEGGRGWSYCCRECNFDLHPKCALMVEEEGKPPADEGETNKEGYVCDGEVCRKA